MTSAIRSMFDSDAGGSTRLRQARITSSAQIANRILNLGVKFLTIPLAITLLGPEEYGVWLTLLSLIAWLSMSDLGLPSALVNPLAEAVGQHDTKRIRELVSTTAFLLAGIGVLVASVCTVLALTLPVEHILGMSNAVFNPRIRATALIVVILNLGFLAFRLTDVMTLAMQKGYLGSVQDTLASAVTAVGLFALSRVGGNIVGLALVVIAPSVLGRLGLWWFLVHRFGNDFLPNWRNCSRQSLRGISRNGLLFFAGMWGEMLVLQTPYLIIAQILGAAAVPLFAIPYQVFYSAYVLLNTISGPLWPAYAEAQSKADLLWIRRTHWRVMKESMILATVGFISLAVFIRWFVPVWTGPAYQPSVAMSWLLALLFIQWTANFVFVVLLTGLGFIWQRTAVVLIFGMFNVILSVLFTKTFGVIGVVMGLFMAMLLTQTWYLPWVLFNKTRWVFTGSLARR